MSEHAEFVSETVSPDRGTADASAMSRGLAGLPTGFTWRGRHYAIREVLQQWKQSEPEGHRPGAERYYRKHYFRVRVDSGETMTLYVVRHMKRGENPTRRWWLYSIDRTEGESDSIHRRG
ncbi:MAG: DUF6504 family protein [Phycisphaerae bacterium]